MSKEADDLGHKLGGIEIYDIKNQKLLEGNVSLPDGCDSGIRAVVIDDYKQSAVIVNGYLRNCWKEKTFVRMAELPLELIDMMITFYCQEYLHIMNVEEGTHCKVLLADWRYFRCFVTN